MEEKKLTDEEIAKAILQQVEYNAGIPYIDEWLKVKTVKFADILNFIYRLQDKADGYERKIENGGLVSIDWHNEQVGHLEEENAELQKQLDELKSENTELYKEHTTLIAGSILKQQDIVKDTAKAVIMDMFKEIEGYERIDRVLERIAERYGVEVE